MANLSKTTRDREEIRRWAEERGGKPAHVKTTGSQEDIGILRIEFPGFGRDENLEPISWEDFFDKFNERDLVLVYQEETAGGERSNFNKLIGAKTAAESGAGRSGRTRGSRSKSAASRSSRSGQAAKTARKTTNRAAAKNGKKATAKKKTANKKTVKKATGKKGSSKKTASKRSARSGTARKKSAGARSTAKKRR